MLVEQQDGSAARPADGVVVVRSVEAQIGPTARLLRGVYAGIRSLGVPAVGVEVSDDDAASIETFQRADLSTVDNVDTAAGKLALAILLSEPAVTGDYGTKPTARDGVLPTVTPVPAAGG